MDEEAPSTMNVHGGSAYGPSKHRRGARLPSVNFSRPSTNPATQDTSRLRPFLLPLYITAREPTCPAPTTPPQPTRPAPTAPPATDTTSTSTALAKNIAATDFAMLPAKTQLDLTTPAHNMSELTEAEGTIFEMPEVQASIAEGKKCEINTTETKTEGNLNEWSAFDFGFDKDPNTDPFPNLTAATQLTYNAATLHQPKPQQKSNKKPSREEELLAQIAEVEKQRTQMLRTIDKIDTEKKALEMNAPARSATFNDVPRAMAVTTAIPDAPSGVLRQALDSGHKPEWLLGAARIGLEDWWKEHKHERQGEKKRAMERLMATFEADIVYLEETIERIRLGVGIAM